MPLINVTIGPFEAVYIGNAGQSAKLTRIWNLRKNGANIKEGMETEFNPLTLGADQAGNHIYRVTLTFIAGEDMPKRIARGLGIADDINTDVGNQHYSLFLLHPNYDIKESWYFPSIRSEIELNLNAEKTQTTDIPILLTAEHFDKTYDLAYNNTPYALQSAMGTQYPFA